MHAFAVLLNLVTNLALIGYTLWFVRELVFHQEVPPFIRTRVPVALEVRDAFGPLPKGSILYDLGCGDGRVVAAIAEANPQATCIGVEMRTVPFLLAKWRLYRHPLPNVRYIQKNFFTVPLTDATHVYTYLFPKIMNDLLPKFEKELPKGARLVSLDFVFADKQPVRTIPLRSMEKNKLGRELNVYQF